MRGKSAYLDKEVLTPEVRSALLEKQMLQSDTRSAADCIVVDDVTQPGMRNLWVAVLLGIPMLSKRIVMDSVGPMVQYQKAIDTTRHIWVSPEFRAMRPAVFQLLEEASDRDGSKWAIIRGDFTKYQVARRKKGNNATLKPSGGCMAAEAQATKLVPGRRKGCGAGATKHGVVPKYNC